MPSLTLALALAEVRYCISDIRYRYRTSDIGRYLDVKYRYPDVGYHIRCLMVASGLAEWFKKRLAVGGGGEGVLK